MRVDQHRTYTAGFTRHAMPLAAELRLSGAEAARCLGHVKRDRPDAALRRDDKRREPASRGAMPT
jgi:hypothetical protein